MEELTMYKKIIFPFILVFTMSVLLSCKQDKPTEVMVLGTIHYSHMKNPNYNLEDIVQILDSYNPDAICVEIPPEIFRKKQYLVEMTLASIYGIDKELPVYPIDWWTKGTREERAAYKKTDEFKRKKALMDSLRKASKIIREFEEKNGQWKDFSNKKDFFWYNGEEYNAYTIENYRISMEVFGDHLINLYYQTRNDSMVARIKKAIEKHRGEKIIVLTGAEHKHYFDREFDKDKSIIVHQLNDFEIKESPLTTKAVKQYIAFGDPSVYFENSTLQDRFHQIQRRMTPIIHGMGMDFNPYIIPEENIKTGAERLKELETKFGHLPDYKFEKGWISFLQGNYEESIRLMNEVIKDSANVHPKLKWFILPSAVRTQAYCYDMTGKRKEAIQHYRKGKKIARLHGELSESKSRILYDRWIEKPYTHKAE
jgi:tetratricopeptide (TPR) repeat protein